MDEDVFGGDRPDHLAIVQREILEAAIGGLDEDGRLVSGRFQRALDPEHLVADGVAVAERRQHLVDARRAGSGRAHCRLAAARLATAGPDGTSARMPAAGRSVFLRLANQPGSGSIAAGAGAAA